MPKDAGSGALVELEHSGIEHDGEGYEALREWMEGPDAWARRLRKYAAAANAEVRA
jgi:hypothetical protein